jgi:hypothetical protein
MANDDLPFAALDRLHELDQEACKKLMRILQLTREQEYSCLETFAVIDQYIEIVIQRKDLTDWTPFVEHHLELCEECRTEFEALMRIIREES